MSDGVTVCCNLYSIGLCVYAQMWDCETDLPLEMRLSDHCTPSCMLNKGEQYLIVRADPSGGGTTLTVWDLVGDEVVCQLRHDASADVADHVTFPVVCTDDRFAVAGVHNSHDPSALYVILDLTSSAVPDDRLSKSLALDCLVHVTVSTEHHEAVTGKWSGQMPIWTLRSG